MHTLLLFFLPVSLLLPSVLASPTSLANFETQPVNISTLDPVTLNNSLGYIPPIGPASFTCFVTRLERRMPIRPKDIFMTAIQMLEDVTPGDFDSRMPQAITRYNGPNHLAIAVVSLYPAQPIFRRHVMWAISRILNTMEHVPLVGYHAGIFEPRWLGRGEANIEIRYLANPSDGSSEAPEVPTTSKRVNATATVGDMDVAWIYSPSESGALMTMRDIAMGTVGALIHAASQPLDQNVPDFLGDFLSEASMLCYYRAASLPSRFSKTILIQTLAAAARWALDDGDYHELEVTVLSGEQVIAQGGYRRWMPGLSALGNGTTLSS